MICLINILHRPLEGLAMSAETPSPVKLSAVEGVKEASRLLRGGIAEEPFCFRSPCPSPLLARRPIPQRRLQGGVDPVRVR